MSDNQKPKQYDAVLGDQSQALESAAVLGGIEGVKFRLTNPDQKVRIAALQQAFNYGEQGLDLIIESLKDESWDVQNAAYLLLSARTELKVKQALLKLNPQGLKLEPIEIATVSSYGVIRHQQRLARYFTENLGNGVALEMAAIPGGTFIMGAPETEEGSGDWERPQHEVTIQPFFMGKYPVTQAQWRAVVALPKVKYDLKPDPFYFQGNDLPIDDVRYHMSVEFCARLSRKTGRDYRLPSEAEWEYACRAGTTTPFHFGETITRELANYDRFHQLGFVETTLTTPVGQFPPNAFGLYDMHGGVWEICADTWYYDNYDGAPKDGSAWIHSDLSLSKSDPFLVFTGLLRGASSIDPNMSYWSESDEDHVYPGLLRGGWSCIDLPLRRSYYVDPDNYCYRSARSARSASRMENDPDEETSVGFRVVCGVAARS